MSEKYRMISELKLNDYLKKDGQNCAVLLLGLRNDCYLHQNKFSACKSADDCKQRICSGGGKSRSSTRVRGHNNSDHPV